MANYKLVSRAKFDLDEIWAYIARDNVEAAIQVEDDLRRAFVILGDNPFIGHLRADLTKKSLRFWNIHSYLIIYNPDTKPIEILRILSSYRDIPNII